MAAIVTPHQRHLRVALLFGGTIEAEEVLTAPKPVVLGSQEDALLPLPMGAVEGDRVELMKPASQGYELSLHPAMSGSLWLGGARKEVESLKGERVVLGPDDYGVVKLGTVALFFQMVRPAGRIGRGLPVLLRDAALLLSLLLSLFLHGAIALLFLLAHAEAPPNDPLELPPDLVRRFMVTPPPEDLLEETQPSGTDTQDVGIRDREEAGGRAHEGEEGRVGREDAEQEQTEMEGPVTGGGAADRVRNIGLLGALRGGEGQSNALESALQGPSIADLLGGLGSSRTVMGRGSGGAGLRGSGSGGGGDGPGTLFGAGNLGTGVGAGRGAGGGRGRSGPGAAGRPREEVRVTMTTARPRVSGYLSPEQIMRVVRRNQAAVRYCYENELQRQPSLRGRIEIQWRIARNGSVSSARVGSSTMRNARVEGCIVRQVRRWRFDQPDGGEVDVNFPFIFGTGG